MFASPSLVSSQRSSQSNLIFFCFDLTFLKEPAHSKQRFLFTNFSSFSYFYNTKRLICCSKSLVNVTSCKAYRLCIHFKINFLCSAPFRCSFLLCRCFCCCGLSYCFFLFCHNQSKITLKINFNNK